MKIVFSMHLRRIKGSNFTFGLDAIPRKTGDWVYDGCHVNTGMLNLVSLFLTNGAE